MSTPLLFDHVFDESWEQVIERCTSHPEEAKYQDERSWTALHYACQRNPPVNVVTAIVAAFPGAPLVQTTGGMIPLHFASCFSRADVVEVLLADYIATVNMRSNHDETPLQYLCRLQEHIILGAIDRDLLFAEHRDIFTQRVIDDELSCYWNTAILLVRASYCGSLEWPLPECKVYTLLHGCAGMDSCPPCFLQLAVKLYPHLLKVSDDDGNLPLHVAAAASGETKRGNESSNSSLMGTIECLIKGYPNATTITNDNGDTALHVAAGALVTRDAEDEHARAIKLLIEAYPGATQISNRDGFLPLQLAVTTGKNYHAGVKDILEAFPAAPMVRHQETHLFSAMLAAVGNRASLDSSYELLRSWPELNRFSLQMDHGRGKVNLRANNERRKVRPKSSRRRPRASKRKRLEAPRRMITRSLSRPKR